MKVPRTLPLDGKRLTLDQLERAWRDPALRVSLTASAERRVRRSREVIERRVREGETIYGVNTGFGKLSSVRISPEDVGKLQENLVRSHAVGVGPDLPAEEARLALLLRLHTLTLGYSGVRPALVRHLAAMANRGVVPLIPEQGSVGASGDLAPLAHLALVAIGEGEAVFRGKRMRGAKALAAAGLRPLRLAEKEGLALINGTQIMTAILASVAFRARRLAKIADVAAATSLEALKGTLTAFDPRIQAVRPHPGQAIVSRNVARVLKGSAILQSHADCSKVQDSYSLRCVPQVHGASRDALGYVLGVLEREVNSATDNPLVFPDDDEILSGGNFHGQPVAIAGDLLGIALAELGAISERRTETLVNPDLSGLPAFLTPDVGLNSGMMITQVVAAALVSENKIHAHPASVDSIPTSANKEDHVSMGVTAARKCRTILENIEWVLSIELLCGAQGLEFLRPLRPGRGVEAARRAIRRRVPPLARDRVLHDDMVAIRGMVADGSLLAEVEEAAGPLE
ncbi:MAG: histidine ammonia-lyase [Planctomycetota bacterium]